MRKLQVTFVLLAVILGISLVGCKQAKPPGETVEPVESTDSTVSPPESEQGGMAMAFELRSPAFTHEGTIPPKYTCDGEDISPRLEWNDPPEGTQSFALIADDPDAPVGTWVHWVLYNIPAGVRALPEAIAAESELPEGSRHGKNGWRRLYYGGPCPPSGTHRYFFKLYALDTTLNLKPGANKGKLLKAMEGHILAETELMGTYQRK